MTLNSNLLTLLPVSNSPPQTEVPVKEREKSGGKGDGRKKEKEQGHCKDNSKTSKLQ